MPLAAGKEAFIQHLINAEDPPAATQQEATNRFVDGYIIFIANSTTTPFAPPVPINPGPLQIPTARKTFESSLLLAYQSTDAVTFCDKTEIAIKAFYLACGGAAALFTAATGFLFPTPLKQYWLASLGAPTTDGRSAKEKVVSGIIQWKAASQVVFPVPPGGIGPQSWV